MLKAGSAARRLSLQWRPPRTAEEVGTRIETVLHAIDRHLQGYAPAWIGHCKLLVASDDQMAYASITMAGDEPRWSANLPPLLHTAEATLYAAIYGVSDADVGAALDANFGSLNGSS